MKKIFTLWLFVTISIMSYTQSEKKQSSIYPIVGVQFMNFKNINNKLSSNNLPEINNAQFYYGSGGNTNFEKVLFGGEGYLLQSIIEKGNSQLKSRGSLGYLYVGYKIIEKESFYLTPKLGLGGGGLELEINSKTIDVLDNYLLSGHSSNLSLGYLIIHSGLKAGFSIDENVDFNFDFGYNYGFENDWTINNGQLTESVSDKVGGFFK